MLHFRLSTAPGAAARMHLRISRSFFWASLGAAAMYSSRVEGRGLPGMVDSAQDCAAAPSLAQQKFSAGTLLGNHVGWRREIAVLHPLHADVLLFFRFGQAIEVGHEDLQP